MWPFLPAVSFTTMEAVHEQNDSTAPKSLKWKSRCLCCSPTACKLLKLYNDIKHCVCVVLRLDRGCKGGNRTLAQSGLWQCERRPAGGLGRRCICFSARNNRPGVNAPQNSAGHQVGGTVLLPRGSTGSEIIWLACFKCDKEKVYSVATTLLMGSFLDGPMDGLSICCVGEITASLFDTNCNA